MAKAIMVQGAGSNVGKSMLVAGIAREMYRELEDMCETAPKTSKNGKKQLTLTTSSC